MGLAHQLAWQRRKQKYGATGAKNPEAFSKKCSQSQMGHVGYSGFKNHTWGGICQCGQEHGEGAMRRYFRETGSGQYHGGFFGNGHTYEDVCPKCGEHHQPGMLGKHQSEESKMKSSESNKLAHNTPEMLAKKSADATRQWRDPARLARRLASFQEHEDAVQEEADKLRADGYEVLPLDKVVRPDMIAKKDGKLFAVEVDFDGNTRKGKYDGVTFFDDVIWRYRHREPLYKANCQTCGKEFGYDIKSANQKFCSEKCYYASMEGKEERPWLVESRVRRGRAAHDSP